MGSCSSKQGKKWDDDKGNKKKKSDLTSKISGIKNEGSQQVSKAKKVTRRSDSAPKSDNMFIMSAGAMSMSSNGNQAGGCNGGGGAGGVGGGHVHGNGGGGSGGGGGGHGHGNGGGGSGVGGGDHCGGHGGGGGGVEGVEVVVSNYL